MLRPQIHLFVAFLLFIHGFSAYGYYSTLETGELLKEGEYKATAESQLLTEDTTGVNFIGRFDTWLSEELNFQGVFGFGEVDLQLSGFIKWVPYPDYGEQPAIGFKAGALYSRIGNENELSARWTPFISKAFRGDFGIFSPFASLPTGIRSINGDIDIPVQIAGGVEWKTPDLEKLAFLFEAGFDVNDAFSYLSFAVSLQMDDTRGIVLE